MHKKPCKKPTIESLANDLAELKNAINGDYNGPHCSVVSLLEKIIMNQAELAAALNKLGEQLTKVGGETTKLLADIADLKTQIANAPVTPELQAAFDKVAAQAQLVDDMVPDAPPPA